MKKFTLLILAVFSLTLMWAVNVSAANANKIDPASRLSSSGDLKGIVDCCAPIGSEGVYIYIPGTSFNVKTGSDGEFRFYNVPEGTYDLMIETPGQTPLKVSNVEFSKGKITDLGTVPYCPDSKEEVKAFEAPEEVKSDKRWRPSRQRDRHWYRRDIQ